MPVTEEFEHFIDHNVSEECACEDDEEQITKDAMDSYIPFFNKDASSSQLTGNNSSSQPTGNDSSSTERS